MNDTIEWDRFLSKVVSLFMSASSCFHWPCHFSHAIDAVNASAVMESASITPHAAISNWVLKIGMT